MRGSGDFLPHLVVAGWVLDEAAGACGQALQLVVHKIPHRLHADLRGGGCSRAWPARPAQRLGSHFPLPCGLNLGESWNGGTLQFEP